MKRFGKWLAIGLGLLLVLVLAALVLVKVMVTPERVRQTVLPLAEQALHRQVSLGGIEVSLFSGIELDQLAIAERQPGAEPFVAADKVVLHYRFWPLLLGRVMVDEVRLERPRIRIIRQADGKFNFSDLAAEGPGPGTTVNTAGGEGSGPAFDLLVSKVILDKGEAVLLDYTHDPKAPYRLRFTGVGLRVSDFALDRSFPFEGAAKLDDGRFATSGRFNLANRSGDLEIKLENVDAAAFGPYLATLLPGKVGGLQVSADLKLQAAPQHLESSGTVDLDHLDLVLDAFQDAPLRQAHLAADYAVKVDLDRQQLTLEQTRLTLNGIAVELSGKLGYGQGHRAVDLAVALPALDLRRAVDALPAGLTAPVAGYDLAGQLDLQLKLVGPMAQPARLLQTATARLTAVQASVGGLRPALTGTVQLTGGTLKSEQLQLVSGDNRADLELQAGHLFEGPPSIQFALSADRFDLDPLLKGSAGAAGAGEQKATPAGAEPGPFDLPLTAEGTVKVGQALWHGLQIDDFDLHLILQKNVVTIDRLQGKLAGGIFADTARIELDRPGLAYTSSLQLTGVEAGALAGAFSQNAAAVLHGSLNAQADLSGKGLRAVSIRKHLSGKGTLTLRDGRIDGGPLAEGLAAVVGIDQLHQLEVKELDGNFRIDQGQVRFDTRWTGSQVKLAPRGTLGLDGGLDVTLDLRLAPDLAGRLDRGGKVARYFRDRDGWLQVPLRLGGSLDQPKFAVDAGAAVEKAGQQLQRKLEKKLLERLAPQPSEPATTPAPEPGEEHRPAKEKPSLEDTFKKLLGD